VTGDFTTLPGWFYFDSGQPNNLFYANVQGADFSDNTCSGEENSVWEQPIVDPQRFVLNFDFQFDETQPDARMDSRFKNDP
jgi:hypothetical protein